RIVRQPDVKLLPDDGEDDATRRQLQQLQHHQRRAN
ncbi:MAG: hypothetical protein ACI8UD_003567, partial [Planctomycetota bacterium]